MPSPDSMPAELRARARELARSPYRAIPRISLDLAMWAGAAALAAWIGNPWVTAAAVFFIGFVCIHDLLIQGHDGVHSMIARHRWVNEPVTWLCHALAGCSATAHRAFHLQHHRRTHRPEDPEYRVLKRLGGARGASYLVLPFLAPASLLVYAMFGSRFPGVRRRTLRDMAGVALLHGSLLGLLGSRLYLTFVVAPGLTGLATAFIVRSIFEHHGATPGDPWRHARTLDTNPLMRILWSNINHHLEHHLFPKVPVHRMPELRILLEEEYSRRGVEIARGFLPTAAKLLREPGHFRRGETRRAP